MFGVAELVAEPIGVVTLHLPNDGDEKALEKHLQWVASADDQFQLTATDRSDSGAGPEFSHSTGSYWRERTRGQTQSHQAQDAPPLRRQMQELAGELVSEAEDQVPCLKDSGVAVRCVLEAAGLHGGPASNVRVKSDLQKRPRCNLLLCMGRVSRCYAF